MASSSHVTSTANQRWDQGWHIYTALPPTSSLVQTTTGDAIWRVELKCLKDGQSFRAFYINLSTYLVF